MILLNLCFALLGLYFSLFFLEKVAWKGGCVAVGALSQFFLLAAHAWMSVEAFNMYLMFIKVLNINIHRFMTKACLFAWGMT